MVEQAIRGWQYPSTDFATVPISGGPCYGRGGGGSGGEIFFDEDALMKSPHIYFSDLSPSPAAHPAVQLPPGGQAARFNTNVQ